MTDGSNPPMKTIEGEIYEAFAKSGAILKANAVDPSKVSPPSLTILLRSELISRAVFNGQLERIKVCMPLAT